MNRLEQDADHDSPSLNAMGRGGRFLCREHSYGPFLCCYQGFLMTICKICYAFLTDVSDGEGDVDLLLFIMAAFVCFLQRDLLRQAKLQSGALQLAV